MNSSNDERSDNINDKEEKKNGQEMEVKGEEKVEENVSNDDSDEGGEDEANVPATTTTTNAPAIANTSKVVRPPELPLEWTRMGEVNNGNDPASVIRLPAEVSDFSKEDEEIIIVGTAGKKITKMGEDLYEQCNPNLKQLVLRSHLIKTIEGISAFKELELLELYDNMVDSLSDLNTGDPGPDGVGNYPGISLRTLDMSYNVIRDMTPVSYCQNLVELYLANNKLKQISGLQNLTKLRKIDLGANRFRTIPPEEFANLTDLEELWLGKNKIEKIEGLSTLKKLRRLDIQSNRIQVIENLDSQVDTLEELYLAHNGIDNEGASSSPTGLCLQFKVLSTIDMSRNFLTSTRSFAHLTTLDELWLSGNKISDFEEIKPLSNLGTNGNLEGIYLEYNPVASDYEYRIKLKQIIPSLQQIDADMVTGMTTAMLSQQVQQQQQQTQQAGTADATTTTSAAASMATGTGTTTASAESFEQEMKRMQNTVVEKAIAETKKDKQEKDEESK